MAEQNVTTAEEHESTKEQKLGFKECLEIYIDSLEQDGTDTTGNPIYKFKDGVTREGLQKRMGKTEAALATTLPKIKKYLHYGSTVFEYNGKEMNGVGEESLQATLNMANGKFISYCDEELKKPTEKREVKVVQPGYTFPDFSGTRASGLKNPGEFAGIFNKLKGLSTPKEEPAKK